MGPFIKYVTLFWTNFDAPPPVTHCHTSRDPLKYVTHLGTPEFSVVHAYIHVFTGRFVLVRGVLVWGVLSREFLSGRFCSGWFMSVPSSARIHPLQQKLIITFNYRIHMYEKI